MHFEIRFTNGLRVPFELLNEEAAYLWGIGIARDKYKYVFPPNTEADTYDENTSWHEMIGLAIMHPQLIGAGGAIQQNWHQVKESMLQGHIDAKDVWEMKTDDMIREIKSSLEYLSPFFKLIDQWYDKGYKPVKVK